MDLGFADFSVNLRFDWQSRRVQPCAKKLKKSSFICCTKIERLSPKPDQSSETAIAVVTISVDLSSLPD